jgi:type IV pilus assembly protein PilN
MAKINLLPWREAYRKEKKEQFLAVLGGVLALSALFAYLWVMSVESAIENQNARNHLLETEIAVLEKQVQEISELKKIRDDLLARIKIIQDLQGTRPLIVRYFDDFARAIPDGVFITMLSRVGETLSIEGIAESYNRVASLMRNLEDSEWFASAKLTSVTAAPQEGEQANAFKMSILTSAPGDKGQAQTDADAAKQATAKASTADKNAGGK